MLGVQALEAMSEEEVLDVATACAETVRRAEVDLLRVAYQWAVLHDPARLDPAETTRPGRERARRYGGAGVAEVCEFAAAELGARIGRTTHAAAALIADAQDLRHRHPVLWARVQAGEVRASYARHVCGQTRELSPGEAAYVDAEVAESADGRIPWTRFEALVTGKVAAAAPALARAKERKARRARFAKRIGKTEHGMGSFLVRADLATIEALDAAVTEVAGRLTEVYPDDPDARRWALEPGETAMGVDDRRVLGLLMLTNPGCGPDARAGVDLGDLLPRVTLFVHLDGRPEREIDEHGQPLQPLQPLERVARVEGHGPVTESWLREVLGPHARFTVTPVLDLAGQVPVDAYEIPQRHRRAVRLMTPADVFPFASCTSPAMQVDHTVPHDGAANQGGPSAIGNYGPMTTTHHRIKTHGRWQVQQPFPGIYVWRDPHGAHYLVDHTGTRRLPEPPPHTPRPRPLVLEIHHSPIQIDYDLTA